MVDRVKAEKSAGTETIVAALLLVLVMGLMPVGGVVDPGGRLPIYYIVLPATWALCARSGWMVTTFRTRYRWMACVSGFLAVGLLRLLLS